MCGGWVYSYCFTKQFGFSYGSERGKEIYKLYCRSMWCGIFDILLDFENMTKPTNILADRL